MRKSIALILALGMVIGLNAQSKFWEGGLILGGSVMHGDLVDQRMGSMNDVNPVFGLMARRYFNENLAFRANIIHSRLKADDRRSFRLTERGFRTETPLTELSVDLQYDILGHRRGKTGLEPGLLSPYIFAGIGLGFTNPKTNYNNRNGVTTLDQNADVSNTRFVLPAGAGLRLDMKPNLAVALEIAPRATFSDYLDGVSQSGNPDKDDWYAFGTVQLLYKFTTTDRDGDGIADADDACPEIAGVEWTQGCPDRDNDRVADNEDACPDIPGTAAMLGCPDRDNDGITDKEDGCPDQAGPKESRGCPDPDGDGLVAYLDKCPNEAGPPENDGCPYGDPDQDGVPDNEDDCPGEPGPAANNGCPYPDADGDGTPDIQDKCPDEVGTAANGGCPESVIEEKAREVMEFATRNIRFATDNDEFLPGAYAILDEVAGVLRERPVYKLRIEGYTDSRGSFNHNQVLSESRARRCYEYLRGKGIPADRMQYAGHGENDPVASNLTEAGRLQNRRVEFLLYQ